MQTGEGKNLKANFINAMQAKILSGELKRATGCRRSGSLPSRWA